MSLATFRTALSDAVDAISGIRCVGYVTDQVATPQAMITRGAIEYHKTFGGTDDLTDYNCTVDVYVTRTHERGAQILLDTLAEPTGATSVKVALETAAVAAAAGVDYVLVTGVSEVRVATIGAVEYLTQSFDVEAAV